jgi:hypothetical protein
MYLQQPAGGLRSYPGYSSGFVDKIGCFRTHAQLKTGIAHRLQRDKIQEVPHAE